MASPDFLDSMACPDLSDGELDDAPTPLARSTSLASRRLRRCCSSSSSVSSSGASTGSSLTSASASAESSSGLLRLSLHARSAVTLNQVRRVDVGDATERLADGATVYALDVFVHGAQKGLPSPLRPRRARLEPRPAQYRLEYRYSELRALRERLRGVLTRGRDPMHAKWCAYCSRVAGLVEHGCFPSRAPGCASGAVAACCGVKRLLERHRRAHLGEFLNRLLRAAKDTSYRCDGIGQCPNFAVVSRMLMLFLAEPSARASRSPLA